MSDGTFNRIYSNILTVPHIRLADVEF
jgi:hypothetical protein